MGRGGGGAESPVRREGLKDGGSETGVPLYLIDCRTVDSCLAEPSTGYSYIWNPQPLLRPIVT